MWGEGTVGVVGFGFGLLGLVGLAIFLFSLVFIITWG